MKRSVLILAFLFSIFFKSNAQLGDIPAKWGKFSKEELSMKTYAADSGASAVMLYKIGSVGFDEVRGVLRTKNEYLIRIKILNSAGFKFGNIEIPYIAQNSIDRFQDFKAHTINQNDEGKIIETEVNNDLIFDEDINGYYHLRKFAFPNIREGSILEYRYTLISNDFFILKRWDFQEEIPVAWSEYRTYIPDAYTYTVLTRGLEGMDIVETGNSVLVLTANSSNSSTPENLNVVESRYVKKNAFALRHEPFSISKNAYRTSISMQLNNINLRGYGNKPIAKDWIALGDLAMKAEWFGEQLRSYSFTKSLIGSLTLGATTNKEKMINIYNYVKSHIVWNGVHSFYIYDLKKAFERRSGTGTEVNAILICLLREAGIEAHPIFVCTRSFGELQEAYCMINQFNHILVQVQTDDGTNLLDAIDPFRPYQLIDYNNLNSSGLLVKESGSSWIDPIKTATSKSFINYNLILNKKGVLAGTVNYSGNNYEGMQSKKEISKTRTSDYFKNLLMSDNLAIKLDSVTLVANDSNSTSISMKSLVTYNTDLTNKNIYITPFINADLHSNPLKSEKRNTPVEFDYPVNKTCMMNIVIPENYKIVEVPKSVKVSLPDNSAVFTFLSSVENNSLQFKSVFEINKINFPINKYSEIQEFFANISRKYSEQIVLEKNGN